MIFDFRPTDWRDLEEKVCQIFVESGCEATRAQTLQIARGEVDVDVVVYDRTRQPELLILCECKHWSTRVPQAVVHAFRTVVADSGAHLGYLISNAGFQSGAYEAAANANLRLISWEQFQAELYDRWFDAMVKRLQPLADEIFEYMDVFNDRLSNAIDGHKERASIVAELWTRYSLFIKATSYRAMTGDVVSFPLEGIDPGEYPGPDRTVVFSTPRAYFDAMFPAAKHAVAAFERFISTYGKRGR